MNITLDPTNVPPQIGKDFIALALSLGYEIVSDQSEVLTHMTDSPFDIPYTYPIDVSQGANIVSVSAGIPMSDYCRKNLTDENFCTKLSAGRIRGGFHDMEKAFESSDAVVAIEELGRKTGRSFRVGTSLELLLFWLQNRARCPRYFVALGNNWNGHVLHWSDDFEEFNLYVWDGEWHESDRVFFVEDLELSVAPS